MTRPSSREERWADRQHAEQKRLVRRRVPAKDGDYRTLWQRVAVRAGSPTNLGLKLVAVAHLLGADRPLVAVHILAEEPVMRRDISGVSGSHRVRVDRLRLSRDGGTAGVDRGAVGQSI